MKTMKPIALLMTVLAFPGCLVLTDDGHLPCRGSQCDGVALTGDIGFYWAFATSGGSVTDSCQIAGVADLDVVITDLYNRLEYSAVAVPCHNLGAIIDNFATGTYVLELSGFCSRGVATHHGAWEIDIYPGYNEYGTLVLDRLGSCF